MMSMTRERVRRLASAAILAAALSAIAAAPAAAFGPACSTPTMTQAYSAWGDSSWYTLAPGQTAGDFNGDGWILLGGARIVTTQLDDGTTGHVLDLPAGSRAISPLFCVDPTYRTVRAMTRSVNGPAGASLFFTYAWGRTAANSVSGDSDWNPTRSLDLYPSSTGGWQLAKFKFSTGLGRGDLQVYNLYVDPYSRG
jgi:hypothetical protein